MNNPEKITTKRELHNAVIDSMSYCAHAIRGTIPKSQSTTYFHLPIVRIARYIHPSLHGEQTLPYLHKGKIMETAPELVVRVEFDRVTIRLVDALSFLVNHERRPLDDAKKEIRRIKEENQRLREENRERRQQRSPEAILWNQFMGRS